MCTLAYQMTTKNREIKNRKQIVASIYEYSKVGHHNRPLLIIIQKRTHSHHQNPANVEHLSTTPFGSLLCQLTTLVTILITK